MAVPAWSSHEAGLHHTASLDLITQKALPKALLLQCTWLGKRTFLTVLLALLVARLGLQGS